jgi:hypothetical protein
VTVLLGVRWVAMSVRVTPELMQGLLGCLRLPAASETTLPE